MSKFTEIIHNELQRIEHEEQVKIIYACESGSRAWGIPSQDSDYDVRFIYVRPVEWYLSIFEKRDVIERPISDRLDINGWDLKKALNLFRKSNPPLLEWLQSPVPYIERFTVIRQIRELSKLTFSPRSGIYHYLHMAKRNYRDFLQGDVVKTKKYLYVLRPILASIWTLEKGDMPPVDFRQLLDGLQLGVELRHEIDNLLLRKMSGDELEREPKIKVINDFLEEQIGRLEEAAKQAPAGDDQQDEVLDALFRKALEEVWKPC